MPLLLSKGFKFEKTTLSYPGWRGDEDIYTKKPKFKYTFRVFRIYKGKPNYGLYVGVGNQFRELDNLVADNIDIEGTVVFLTTGNHHRAFLDHDFTLIIFVIAIDDIEQS